jgi:hypothetical protein
MCGGMKEENEKNNEESRRDDIHVLRGVRKST